MSEQTLPAPAAPTGNRFSVVTPTDNSAPIIIVTILSLIFSALVFSVRIFVVKWKRHGLDDWVLAVGHVFAVGHWTGMLIAIQNGLGIAISLNDPLDLHIVAISLVASQILFLLTLCASKLSLLLIIRSLFHWESRTKTLLIDITIFLVLLWGIAASLTMSISCSPNYIYTIGSDIGGQCVHQVLRFRCVVIAMILIDFLIAVMPGIFVCTFDIKWEKKMLVICAFSFKLPLIPLSTFYLLTTITFLTTPPTGLTIVSSLIFQECLIGYSLMSATIPCLRSFVEGFTTRGVSYVRDSRGGSLANVWNSTQGSLYEMKWFKKKFGGRSGEENGRDEGMNMERAGWPSERRGAAGVVDAVKRESLKVFRKEEDVAVGSQGSRAPIFSERTLPAAWFNSNSDSIS